MAIRSRGRGRCRRGSGSQQGSNLLSSQEGGHIILSDQRLGEYFDPILEQVLSNLTGGRKMPQAKYLVGDNDRLAPVAAALGRAQLLHFPMQQQTRTAVFRELDIAAARLDGISPLDPQPWVDQPPVDRWAFRVDLSQWGDMTIEQIRVALAAEWNCAVDRIHTPLVIDPEYDPRTDRAALNIDPEFWDRLQPDPEATPNAIGAFRSVLVIAPGPDHDHELDFDFPTAFAEGIYTVQDHAERIARELVI